MDNIEQNNIDIQNSEDIINQEKEKFKEEIFEYDNLLNHLKVVKDLRMGTETSKSSLAFLVEETKNKIPDTWKNELKDLELQIEAINHESGDIGVSWLIAEKIYKTYIEFLDNRKLNVDSLTQNKLESIKKNVLFIYNFSKATHDKNEPVAFGGVSMSYIPKWYYYIK